MYRTTHCSKHGLYQEPRDSGIPTPCAQCESTFCFCQLPLSSSSSSSSPSFPSFSSPDQTEYTTRGTCVQCVYTRECACTLTHILTLTHAHADEHIFLPPSPSSSSFRYPDAYAHITTVHTARSTTNRRSSGLRVVRSTSNSFGSYDQTMHDRSV
jgi:hypothetical protein